MHALSVLPERQHQHSGVDCENNRHRNYLCCAVFVDSVIDGISWFSCHMASTRMDEKTVIIWIMRFTSLVAVEQRSAQPDIDYMGGSNILQMVSIQV